MNIFVFRNQTVEPLFANLKNVSFSEYGSVYCPNADFDLFIWCYFLSPNSTPEETTQEIEDARTKLQLVYENLPKEKFLVFTLDARYLASWQLSENSIRENIAAFNDELYRISSSPGQLKVINIGDFLNSYTPSGIVDAKYYYLSQIIISPLISPAFHLWFSGVLQAINGVRKKCLVIDLDDTFWGGILGEDGLNGIKLGNTYPGSAFLDFQKQLKEAKRNGVMLAICSKNNEEDVWHAFDNHPDILLKKDDFVSFRINWNDKASNIKEIADELNIGLDSLVFIDDNPVERERVSQLVPDVTVPDFPDQPYKLARFFQEVYRKYFLLYRLTSEDLAKTEQYKANSERANISKGFDSINDYLLSLDTRISIDKANAFNIPRIAQLTQKTNQFNLTTKRYTEPEISKLIDSGNLVFCAAVSDKFGDSGITAVGIITFEDKKASIDSYLLSCRILGREIELAIVKTVMNHLLEKGYSHIESHYLPTAKNKQTENFYEKLGFKPRAKPDGSKEYRYEMNTPFETGNLFSIQLNF